MPTIVSTTPLTPSESDLLNQSHAAGCLRTAQDRLATWQKKLAEAQKAIAAATTARQAMYGKVLSSKLPTPVSVPGGATITRVTVNGVDSLQVTTP